MTSRLSPVLDGLGTYPFVRLEAARARLRAAGVEIIDFGMGEPREETPAFIREALAAAIRRSRPTRPPSACRSCARRSPAGRRAASARRWTPTRRSSRRSAPRRPSSRSRTSSPATRSSVPTPAYPVYERGAAFAGKEVVELPLREADGWLPDLGASTGRASSILWLNYPNNPTGATAPLAFYEQAAALAREHGFVLASDEAYSELYFGDERARSPRCSSATCSHVAVLQHAVQALVDARLPLRASSPATRRSSPR